MSLHQDWNAIVQERARAWENAVRQRQLRAHLPRPRPAWRRHAGNWMIRLGVRLARWGEQMAECEGEARVSVAGDAA